MSPNSLAHLSRSPRFWRDERLPFVEARTIADGRKVTYSRHAHEHFSIGVVTTGRSYYHYGADTFEISAGTVVLMNPGDVHACNPIANEPWSYQMVYIDTPWLTDLQHQLGFSTEQGYRPFNTPYTRDTVLYEGLLELYGILVDEQAEHLQNSASTPPTRRCVRSTTSWNAPPTTSANTAPTHSDWKISAWRPSCRRPT